VRGRGGYYSLRSRWSCAGLRLRWAQQGSAHYTLIVRPLCFCWDSRDIRVTVSGGAVVSRVFVDDGSAVPAGSFPQLGRVEDLFATLDDAIAHHAAHLSASYDAHGVPVTVGIDYDANMDDEEFGWNVTEFHSGE
jgi:hypothetical protein